MELHEEVAGVFARMDALIDELAGDGVRIDPHTHLGLDEDGMSQTLEELITHLDVHKVAKAVTIPIVARTTRCPTTACWNGPPRRMAA